MGRKIKASREGTCPECGESWKLEEFIYWDNSVKNSKNWNVTCKDEACFKEQGGKLTTYNKPKGGSVYVPREQDNLTVVLPKVSKVDESIGSAVTKVDNLFYAAHILTKTRYPDLKDTSQTFGQIRSKFVDQIMYILYNGN